MKFLEDLPIGKEKDSSKIRFGHSGIANTLISLICNCPKPFTIGLFGRWGVGKSSIGYIVQRKIIVNNFNVIYFDVWKYDGDSLRREFLKNIETEFKKTRILNSEYELEKDLYKNVTVNLDSEPRFSPKRLVPLLPYLITAYLTTVIVALLFKGVKDLTIILLQSFIMPILLVILQNIRDVVVTDSRQEEFNRIDSPELFEAKFDEMLSKTNNSILIIIDNLDRCSHHKAIELLTTLKTFLEKQKCVFLIPCDDYALKKHIKKIYAEYFKNDNELEKYADEFIRKFFNVYLRIPEFIDTELQLYTEELLNEINMKELKTTEIASIITSAFRDNPRQIKQFINALISRYLLAKEREKGADQLIKQEGTVTGNPGLLAKLLVIQQKFPEQYLKIRNKEIMINDVPKLENPSEEERDFISFMTATGTTPKKKVSNLRPFFYLKQSTEELNIPDADELEIALEDAQENIVIDKFKKIRKIESELKYTGDFIYNLLKNNENRQERLINICTMYLKATYNLSFKFPDNKIYDITARFLGLELKEQLHRIDPNLIFYGVLKNCSDYYKSDIARQYINILLSQNQENNNYEVTEDWIKNIFVNIFENNDLFKNMKEDIKNCLSNTYATDYFIINMFRNKKNIQKLFLTEEIINKYINSITKENQDDSELIENKVNILKEFKVFMNETNTEAIIIKLIELLEYENKKPARENREALLDKIEDIIIDYSDKLENIKPENLKKLSKTIITGYNGINDWEQKRMYILSMIFITDLVDDSSKNELKTIIDDFWNTIDIEGIRYIFSKCKKDYVEGLIKEYYEIFQKRATQDKEIFKELLQKSGKEDQHKLISYIFNSNQYIWALDLIDNNEIKLLIDKKQIVNILLNRALNIPINNRRKVYEITNNLKCGNDRELKDKYINQLKTSLMSNDLNTQKISYDAFSGADYLSKEDKSFITNEIIRHLRKKVNLTIDDEPSIRSTILYKNELVSSELNELIYILFDKILIPISEIKLIEVGMQCLLALNIKYEQDEEIRKYYDNLLARINRATNPTIKKTLVEYLKKMSPRTKNQENMDYWKKVNKLNID